MVTSEQITNELKELAFAHKRTAASEMQELLVSYGYQRYELSTDDTDSSSDGATINSRVAFYSEEYPTAYVWDMLSDGNVQRWTFTKGLKGWRGLDGLRGMLDLDKGEPDPSIAPLAQLIGTFPN